METEFTKDERLARECRRARTMKGWNNNNNATPWRRSVTAQAVMWVQACAAGIEAGCGTALGTTCLRPLLYITIIHYGVETFFLLGLRNHLTTVTTFWNEIKSFLLKTKWTHSIQRSSRTRTYLAPCNSLFKVDQMVV